MASVVHIHLGPGKLGLGLLVWSGLLANFEVHVVARPGSGVDATTQLVVVPSSETGSDGTPQRLVVESVSQAQALGDLEPKARTAVDNAAHLLITTAVTTAGVSAVAGLIVEIADVRAGGGRSTTFIAGENNPGPVFDPLVEKLTERGVDCRRTMVDRLCLEPPALRRPGARVVLADDLVEWVIEGTPDTETLAALAELEHVVFDQPIHRREVRKRWLVNGGHLALAIMARDHNYDSLDIEAAEPGRSEWLARYHAVVIEVLEREHTGLEGNAVYGRNRVNAWMRHPDPVRRVLSRLNRADLEPFLWDLHRKIGEPLVMSDIDRDSDSWQVVEDLFEVLHRVLCTPEQYEDQAAIHDNPALLDAAVDARCVGMYRDWVGPILGKEIARQRAVELAEAFDDQRAKEFP